MKKGKRLVYLELANEIDMELCSFCKYAECERTGCCSGDLYCIHPNKQFSATREYDYLETGEDCREFIPNMPLQLIVDLVGSILSQGYDEWECRIYSETALTLYGRTADGKSSKVRIGHDGKYK